MAFKSKALCVAGSAGASAKAAAMILPKIPGAISRSFAGFVGFRRVDIGYDQLSGIIPTLPVLPRGCRMVWGGFGCAILKFGV